MKNSEQIFDELLVLNAQSGDEKAFALLVKRWNVKIQKQINWNVHDLELSKDLSQDCWISINRNLRKLTDARKFGAWALRIANNKSIDWIRKNKIKIAMQVDITGTVQPATEEVDVKEDMIERLKAGFLLLSAEKMLVLKMHYLQQLNLDQMSEILNIPKGTVKSRLFMARESLKEKVKF